jgi:hypothetical protein
MAPDPRRQYLAQRPALAPYATGLSAGTLATRRSHAREFWGSTILVQAAGHEWPKPAFKARTGSSSMSSSPGVVGVGWIIESDEVTDNHRSARRKTRGLVGLRPMIEDIPRSPDWKCWNTSLAIPAFGSHDRPGAGIRMRWCYREPPVSVARTGGAIIGLVHGAWIMGAKPPNRRRRSRVLETRNRWPWRAQRPWMQAVGPVTGSP